MVAVHPGGACGGTGHAIDLREGVKGGEGGGEGERGG